MNLPEWFATVAIVLLAIGFPIAVILAWVIDMTPNGPEIDRKPVSAETDADAGGLPVEEAVFYPQRGGDR